MTATRRTLRTKTTLALLAVALATSLAFSAVWFATAMRGQRRAVDGMLVASTARAATAIEGFVRTSLDAMRSRGRVLAIAQGDASAATARRITQSLLTTWRAGDPLHITAIAYLAADGRVIVATDGGRTFGARVDDPAVLRAKEAFTPVVSPVRMTEGDGRYGRFRLAVAVRDGNGDVRGILVEEYSTLIFEQILRDQAALAGAEAQAFLYDRYLIRLAGTVESEQLFRTNNPLPDSLTTRLLGERRLRVTADSAAFRRDVREITQLRDSTYTYALDQRDDDGRWATWLGASSPIRPFDGQVSIEIPADAALGATRDTLLRDAFGLLLAVTVAVSFVAIPVGRRLTAPIQALTETVQRFSGGDEAARASPGSDVETAQLASAFNDLANRIEALVAGLRERTRALEHELSERESLEAELVQTRKLEAMGKLAGGIAHDFNNLLLVILSNVEFVKEVVPPDSEAADALADLEDAARRGGELTQQMLAFARMRTGVPRPLDLGAAVRSSERFLRQVLGAGIELELDAPDELACIEVDPSQLQQVLLNLAVNARDAMPSGGSFAVRVATEGAQCVLTVGDTGQGMEPEVLGRVFEPFFTTKAQGRGTGLGLSTVYGIVSRAGGTVTVASTVGEGTTFTMRFPRAEGVPVLPFEAPSSRPTVRGSATILVVDDEPGVRHAVARALRRVGHRVHEAGSGAEGIAIGRLHRDALQVLVTDVEMPSGSGRVVADTLRAEIPGLRVLLMSGHALDGGPYDVMQKPFTVEVLVGRIEALLTESGGAQPS